MNELTVTNLVHCTSALRQVVRLQRWNFYLVFNWMFTNVGVFLPRWTHLSWYVALEMQWAGMEKTQWHRPSPTAGCSSAGTADTWAFISNTALIHCLCIHLNATQEQNNDYEQDQDLLHGKVQFYLYRYGYRCANPWRLRCCKSLFIISLTVRSIPWSTPACSWEERNILVDGTRH